jgi:DNA invertase Pin-like site-specific DNA recombinase
MAQEESRMTSERVKWGQKRRMEQGVVFGRDMLGYFVKDGKLIVNPDEVDVVKLIFYKYLNEGKGTWTIARELYNSGIKPKRVKEWSNTMILKVLRNEKYVGDLLQKKMSPSLFSSSRLFSPLKRSSSHKLRHPQFACKMKNLTSLQTR